MNCWQSSFLCLVLLSTQQVLPVGSQPDSTAEPDKIATSQGESQANVSDYPTQILRTGVVLSDPSLSPNTRQLSDTIGLTPVLEKLQNARSRLSANSDRNPTLESISIRQDFIEARQEAAVIILKANLDVDFAMGEIEAESQVYNEILSTFTNDRDKKLAKINAASFISNGMLWALCEALSIPSFNTVFAKNPKHVVQWPIPAGIVGIEAGIIPSIASMYTLRAVNGKKKTSEVDPNMLAKLFGYPTNPEIEYPKSVWSYLNQTPADDPKGKKRLDQIIDRWIADANMPEFTDRSSKQQLDVLTASIAQRKGLTIATLTSRTTMLQQLHTEIAKMKRMLLELTMVVQGEKHV